MHARTHACTVVRARGQTDRDKEHFRRCTGRPRSAYLLLLARRGRRTRGRVTPECPRFLLSVPSPSFSSCLSRCLPLYLPLAPSLSVSLLLRCSLYRSLVRPSSSFHGLLPLSPSLQYMRYLLRFFPPPFLLFSFSFSPSLFLPSRSIPFPAFLRSQMPRSISFFLTRYPVNRRFELVNVNVWGRGDIISTRRLLNYEFEYL